METRYIQHTETRYEIKGLNDVSPAILQELLPGDEVITLPTIQPIKSKPFYNAIKRIFDILSCSIALLILFLPMLIIAILIKLDSSGPILYSQQRCGLNGKVFKIYKFRSMYINAEEFGPKWADCDDNRITKIGKFLRKTRLDEIPQFINIIKGDMSLVGPRPERPIFVEAFEERIIGFSQRTLVKPGLSGLAQIKGGYELLPKDKVLYDFEYILNRSFYLDTRIILKTFSIVFTKRGAR